MLGRYRQVHRLLSCCVQCTGSVPFVPLPVQTVLARITRALAQYLYVFGAWNANDSPNVCGISPKSCVEVCFNWRELSGLATTVHTIIPIYSQFSRINLSVSKCNTKARTQASTKQRTHSFKNEREMSQY